jgi:hypothetical protein
VAVSRTILDHSAHSVVLYYIIQRAPEVVASLEMSGMDQSVVALVVIDRQTVV